MCVERRYCPAGVTLLGLSDMRTHSPRWQPTDYAVTTMSVYGENKSSQPQPMSDSLYVFERIKTSLLHSQCTHLASIRLPLVGARGADTICKLILATVDYIRVFPLGTLGARASTIGPSAKACRINPSVSLDLTLYSDSSVGAGDCDLQYGPSSVWP